ncbi:MAG TPA: DNA polymerase III subunit gamma/tau [Candidatus Limnocylindrales bacterium]|nr:DNA polymerase III subunit gamma/tau [Candidatus Limnocylindrales bacterium]
MPSATVPYQALYRRWRAQTFSQIVGQEAVVAALQGGIRLGRLGHGLLFVGPRGTGKTSTARIVAKAVNCLAPVDGDPCDACEPCVAIREGRALDVVELDAASNNGIDAMRDLLPRVYTTAADLRRKVFIIDEVQRISREGWDMLLKPLEEPPPGLLFILCTTEPAKVRPAVVSRLQRYAFRPLTVPQISGKLRRILEAEGLPADDDAVELVAQLAAGGMRDAESMLDQVMGLGLERLTADAVRDHLGLADRSTVQGFLGALVRGDTLAGLVILDSCSAAGRDLGGFVDQLVAGLHEAIVARLTAEPVPTTELDPTAEGLAAAPPAALARLGRRLATLEPSRGPDGARFALELVLLEEAATQPPMTDVPARPAPAPATAPTIEPPPTKAPTALVPAATAPIPPAPSPTAKAPSPSAPAAQAPSPSAPTAPASEVLASGASGSDLDRLRHGWPTLVSLLGQNPALRPLIAACRPVEVDGRVVVLGFPEEQAFLRDIAERRKPALEEGVTQVLGVGFGVRCVIANLDALEPLPEAGDDDLVASFKEIFAGDLADVVEIG